MPDRQVLLAGAGQDGGGPAAGQAGQEHDRATGGHQIEYQVLLFTVNLYKYTYDMYRLCFPYN